MKWIRFDSVGGASGDMILGALLGLGVDFPAFSAQLEAALAEDPTYQAALVDMLAAEQKSTEIEERALRIRAISLLLNDGFERALQLYLDDQNITELTPSAVALLTLSFSEGPRLINVVPAQATTPTADLGLDLEQIQAQHKTAARVKQAQPATLSQAAQPWAPLASRAVRERAYVEGGAC